MTLLSIIIPAYNVEKYIKKTLQSILSQNSNQIETIVIDDGSIDNTYKIAHQILKDVKNAKLIRKKNAGASVARNKGLKIAKGKYILFLDGDDFISKDFFKELKKFLNKKYEIIFWKYDRVDENGKTLLRYEQKFDCKNTDKDTGLNVLKRTLVEKRCWIWTGNAIYRREYLLKNNIFYTEKCIYGEDLEFIVKALVNAKKVKFIKKTLSYYLIRNTSITRSYNPKKFDNMFAFFRTIEYLEKNNVPQEIINGLRYNILPEHFIANITSLKIYSNNLQNKIDFYSELEKNYGKLLKEINLCLRRYQGKNKVIRIMIWSFLLNPRLYLKILNIIDPKIYNKLSRIALKLKIAV